MKTIQTELKLFKHTCDSTHARWIASELNKVLDGNNLKNIDQLHEVTVGRTSNGDVKSGLLWAVVNLLEAKNKMLLSKLDEIKAKHEKEKKLSNDLASAVSGWLALFDKQRIKLDEQMGEITKTKQNKIKE